MNKTPVYLVTGFLGSGKTTFIERAIDHYAEKQRIGIIQNEFAPASIDGKELKRVTGKDFDILEINNGSVFCVCLLSGFIISLKKFVISYHPDILLIEASGLSDVMSVGEIFNSPELQEHIYLAATICIVDAGHFMKTANLMSRVRHQVMIADHLLVNKTDINPGYSEILAKIESINPFGKKHLTTFCDADPDELFRPMSQPSWTKLSELAKTPEDAGRPDVRSAVFRTKRPLNSEYIDEFVRQVASKSYRFKGILWLSNGKSCSVQAVFDDFRYTEIESSGRQTELIAVGKEIDARELKDIYRHYSQVKT